MRRKAVVTDIQRFSIHDGPGIRTTVFLKGCTLACRWCHNPECIRPYSEIGFDARRCLGCFECERVCPREAILREPEVRIDRLRCDRCGLCVEACPPGALSRVGEAWTAGAIREAVLRDTDHYGQSGGGVTFSGGEPLRYARFLEPLVERLHADGVHVTVETAGAVPYEGARGCLLAADLVLFDLKSMDPVVHREWTGSDNAVVLDTFRRAVREGARIVPRMPLVPGVNDGRENLAATAGFLRRHGFGSLVLLPYHRLGEGKLRRIDPPVEPPALRPARPEDLERAAAVLGEEGIHGLTPDEPCPV